MRPPRIWVDCWAYVILGHCNHLAGHQHTGQCLAREQLLLVPGLRRQGAECSRHQHSTHKNNSSFSALFGKHGQDWGRDGTGNLVYQATPFQLYISGSPVSSLPGGLTPVTPREKHVRLMSGLGYSYKAWLHPRVR